MIFHENRLLADDSHVISYLIFVENCERCLKLSSAAVVIGALRVNISFLDYTYAFVSYEFPTIFVRHIVSIVWIVYLCIFLSVRLNHYLLI